ncbi:hypothetical protein L596_027279 [Steinernema carpocapsae]|uniref:Uncharacterized protein n=1 Tax=Steinernema carpocapsae TaxID=34508 RepID=A0A4U5M3W8_STECR|nr:hypothetical protein L596_027279 [Steinernema carpocapsae]
MLGRRPAERRSHLENTASRVLLHMNRAVLNQSAQILKVRSPSTSSTAFSSTLFRDFQGSDADMRVVREQPRARKVKGGRFQNWKEPSYVSPHFSPLQRGVDFTFRDGRPIYATSKKEVDRKLEQIELGKTIVKYLADMREMEKMYIADNARKQAELAEKQRWTPKNKGTEEIF